MSYTLVGMYECMFELDPQILLNWSRQQLLSSMQEENLICNQ